MNRDIEYKIVKNKFITMDETLMLILLVIVMLVGSYLAGNIPLIVNLSEVCLFFFYYFC